jgi:hypothetical protein
VLAELCNLHGAEKQTAIERVLHDGFLGIPFEMGRAFLKACANAGCTQPHAQVRSLLLWVMQPDSSATGAIDIAAITFAPELRPALERDVPPLIKVTNAERRPTAMDGLILLEGEYRAKTVMLHVIKEGDITLQCVTPGTVR